MKTAQVQTSNKSIPEYCGPQCVLKVGVLYNLHPKVHVGDGFTHTLQVHVVKQ